MPRFVFNCKAGCGLTSCRVSILVGIMITCGVASLDSRLISKPLSSVLRADWSKHYFCRYSSLDSEFVSELVSGLVSRMVRVMMHMFSVSALLTVRFRFV